MSKLIILLGILGFFTLTFRDSPSLDPITSRDSPSLDPTSPLPPKQSCPDNPVELGKVCWNRNLDSALTLAESSGKPVFILFQEVPGCSNCTRFGQQIMSHPLMVEAIESLFVPLCIYNNAKGHDQQVLDRYNEPSWNNPVVRIVDKKGNDLTPRMPDFRSHREILDGMARAATLPQWAQLLREEIGARETGPDTATFSMYCFWSGEKILGNVEGVIETTPGFQNGHEVVQVVFNPQRISREKLTAIAQPKEMELCKKNAGVRTDDTPKYYLAQTTWKYVPMTTLQACRANSAIASGQSPESFLSPRQIAFHEKVKANPKRSWRNAIGQKPETISPDDGE